jgi:hypothetical protein
MNESLGECDICGREMSEHNSNKHHLIPQLKGGKNGETVRLHLICHGKIHSIWSEGEIRDNYYTIDLVMTDDRMKKFAKWVSKKDPDFTDGNRLANNHKRKRRK